VQRRSLTEFWEKTGAKGKTGRSGLIRSINLLGLASWRCHRFKGGLEHPEGKKFSGIFTAHQVVSRMKRETFLSWKERSARKGGEGPVEEVKWKKRKGSGKRKDTLLNLPQKIEGTSQKRVEELRA